MQRLLIIGCGDVAQRALPRLVRRYRVYALLRRADPDLLARLRAWGVTPIIGDLDERRSLRRLASLGQWLLHTAPPPNQGKTDQRTRNLLAALGRPRRAGYGPAKGRSLPRAISYISTTGVYGDCAGAWVSETRTPNPRSERGRRRLDAEQCLRQFAGRNGLSLALLRAPGIYALERLPVDRVRRGDPVLTPEEDVFTNHIHADDLARIALQGLRLGRGGRVYNASDDTDLAMGDYYDLLADALGLPRPPRVTWAEAQRRLSPMTLSFMAESRRLRNERIKRELGVTLAYPDITYLLVRLVLGDAMHT